MLVDVINSGWAPGYLSNLTEDIPGYLEAPANVACLPLEAFHRRSHGEAWHSLPTCPYTSST